MSFFDQDMNYLREGTEGFELAIRFFLVFSRFDYALKRAEFTKDNSADACWDKFCSKYRKEFSLMYSTDNVLTGSYLLEQPPKKQILVDNQLGWRLTQPSVHVMDNLSVYTRRVRNNLFHGEKFRMILESNSGRNIQLVEGSLAVIEVFLQLDGNVNRYFYEGLR